MTEHAGKLSVDGLRAFVLTYLDEVLGPGPIVWIDRWYWRPTTAAERARIRGPSKPLRPKPATRRRRRR